MSINALVIVVILSKTRFKCVKFDCFIQTKALHVPCTHNTIEADGKPSIAFRSTYDAARKDWKPFE